MPCISTRTQVCAFNSSVLCGPLPLSLPPPVLTPYQWVHSKVSYLSLSLLIVTKHTFWNYHFSAQKCKEKNNNCYLLCNGLKDWAAGFMVLHQAPSQAPLVVPIPLAEKHCSSGNTIGSERNLAPPVWYLACYMSERQMLEAKEETHLQVI